MKKLNLTILTLFLLSGCLTVQDSTPSKITPPPLINPPKMGITTPTASVKMPKFINHPPPNIQVDVTAFLKASGCRKGPTSEIEGCDNLRAKMGCDKFIQPDTLWGAINPAYPMVLCLILPDSRQYPKSLTDAKTLSLEIIKEIEKEGYLSLEPGKERHYTRLVVLKDGQFQLLKNFDDLKTVFAPIESPSEALSYALMTTQLKAYYAQKIKPAYRYYMDVIEDTHVVVTKVGYDILLYDYKDFGCSSHPTSTTVVTVRANGLISYPSQILAYANPTEDNVCFD
jgi:hypothetical protein